MTGCSRWNRMSSRGSKRIIRIVVFFFMYVIFLCEHYEHNKCLVTSDPLELVTPFRFHCAPNRVFRTKCYIVWPFQKYFLHCVRTRWILYFTISCYSYILLNTYYIKDMVLTHPYVTYQLRCACTSLQFETPPRKSVPYYYRINY